MPPTPKLANLRGIELMHAGSWDLVSGPATTFSRNDILSAVAALACPAIRNPVLKMGHTDTRVPPTTGDGQPTIGWVGNLRTSRDGFALLGDYCGLPAWMTDTDPRGNSVMASAFPDRSIEGVWDFVCPLNHHHPFVVTAVALLGETPPGIGTLASLQDVASLYSGVTASTRSAGTPVTVTIHAAKENTVPNPQPVMVAASTTLDDLREEFRERATWDQWIVEVLLDPLALIVHDDGSGELYRIPVTIDTSGAVTFGAATQVAVAYVDDTAEDEPPLITAAAADKRIVYASRAESRPGDTKPPAHASDPAKPPAVVPAAAPAAALPPPPAQPVPAVPAAEPEPTTEPKEDPVSDLSEIRSRLGLPDSANEAAILVALDAKLGKPNTAPTEPAEPAGEPAPQPTPPPAPTPAEPVSVAASAAQPGQVTLDPDTYAQLQRDAKAGAEARAATPAPKRPRTRTARLTWIGCSPPARSLRRRAEHHG
jgi:hypothetical protein